MIIALSALGVNYSSLDVNIEKDSLSPLPPPFPFKGSILLVVFDGTFMVMVVLGAG